MVKALAGEEFQLDMAKEMSYVPNQDSPGRRSWRGNEGAAAMAAGAANGHATPNSPNWAAVEAKNPIKEYMTKLLTGGDAAADGRRGLRGHHPGPQHQVLTGPARRLHHLRSVQRPRCPPHPRPPGRVPHPGGGPAAPASETVRAGRPLAVPADRADAGRARAYLLVYPLVRNVVISFQHFRLGELIRGGAAFVGFDNYREVLGDAEFWTVVRRTFVLTAVNVVLIMVTRTLVALMLTGLGQAGCGSR